MNTVKFNKRNTKAVAHRGVSKLERENTNAAFIAAGNRSYFGIETDMYKTSDNRFVLMHDGKTGRVSKTDIPIETSTYEELRNLILTDLDGQDRSDLRIPDLEDYIKICKKYDKICVLELKSQFSEEDTKAFCEIINSYGYLENVIFISFHLDNLLKIKYLYPEQKVQYLRGDFEEGLTELLVKNKMDLDIYYQGLTKERLDECHKNGILVNCWTVDNPADAEKLSEWGVDFITTNILE
ncbi:MAG: hypothetical protein J5850_03925 [Clostridia bacterium]|nr:hypothetical protein [Clostridia bacterium]